MSQSKLSLSSPEIFPAAEKNFQQEEDIIKSCIKCSLHKTRTQVVVGEGDPNSNVILVGECPGREEDKEGRPFIGRAGQLLRAALDALCIDTNKIYITNIVKCFPFHKLNPDKEHIDACCPYLEEFIPPERECLIVSVGRISSEYFLQSKISITKISGTLYKNRGPLGNRDILPVIHPSYLLRNGQSATKLVIDMAPMLNYLE